MGSSFVSLSQRGFWIGDTLLEVWLRFLALHVEDPSQPGSAAAAIRDQWLLASSVGLTGCVPADLDEAVSTPEGVAAVRKAVGSLLTALERGPDAIPGGVLNLMGLPLVLEGNLQTSRLIEAGRAFLDLLEGRIATTASDPPLMPGSGPSGGEGVH